MPILTPGKNWPTSLGAPETARSPTGPLAARSAALNARSTPASCWVRRWRRTRRTSPRGDHVVECACRSTSKHADPDKAIAARRSLNRPERSARPAAVAAAADNVLQLQLGLAERKPKTQRAALAAD